MKVILAGYNVDTDILRSLTESSKDIPLTPETISAAYARISRSPKSIPDLRKEAREEVKKARESNRRIIFEMSHHSIAEHAVFNFDILGISRFAIEEFERHRLCSYTEKSQRYVTFKGNYVIPEELKESTLLDDFLKIVALQNEGYQKLFEGLKELNFKKFPSLTRDSKTQRQLENHAKEDARYLLPLATQTQVGATINARNLELMIRRFASSQLKEINQLGEKLFKQVKKIAPSLILFYEANEYDKKTYNELKKYTNSRFKNVNEELKKQSVQLVDYTKDGDEKILAAILFRVRNIDPKQSLKIVRKMSRNEKLELFKKACQYMELYDAAPREFELANLTFELIVSAGCFGQLKRHRMATIITGDYSPEFGHIVPESIRELGADRYFEEIIKESEDVYYRIEKKFPGIGSYVLTNSHCRRVLLHCNLRELYHIARLREDHTAQWDIRDKVHQMVELAKRVMPVTTSLLCSKSDYPKAYYNLFGRFPKVKEVPPPG